MGGGEPVVGKFLSCMYFKVNKISMTCIFFILVWCTKLYKCHLQKKKKRKNPCKDAYLY